MSSMLVRLSNVIECLIFPLIINKKSKPSHSSYKKINIPFILQQQNENDFLPKNYKIKHVPLILNPDECTEEFLFQTPQILMFLYISIRLINFYISIPYGIQCLSFSSFKSLKIHKLTEIHHNEENLAYCRAVQLYLGIICDNKQSRLPWKQVLSPDYVSDTITKPKCMYGQSVENCEKIITVSLIKTGLLKFYIIIKSRFTMFGYKLIKEIRY